MPLPTEQMRKLIAMLGQLGHDNENVRANAGLAAWNLIKAHNCQWSDIVRAEPLFRYTSPPPPPPQPPPRQRAYADFNSTPDQRSYASDYTDDEEFSDLINMASEKAHFGSEWERKFTADMKDRFDKYGMRTRVSEKQWSQLRRMAGV